MPSDIDIDIDIDKPHVAPPRPAAPPNAAAGGQAPEPPPAPPDSWTSPVDDLGAFAPPAPPDSWTSPADELRTVDPDGHADALPPRDAAPGPSAPPTLPASPAPPFVASSTSGDDLTVSLTHARPDPLLGAFVTEGSPDELIPAPAPSGPEPESAGQGPHGGSRADALNELAGIDLGGDGPALGPVESASSFDGLGGLDLSAPPPAKAAADRAPVEKQEDDEDDDEGDDPTPPRGSSLGMMLLASYASAVTFGLIWVLWTGRRLHESPEADDPPTADGRADPGARAGDSRRITPPRPLPREHVTTLGKAVRLGQIEATPLAVTSGPVVLERNFQGRERKPGGDNALKLRLRLKNVSADAVLAPLDEAFVRDRPRADPDSFIETSVGGPTVTQFPLAVESEWSIVGQEFRDLKPGEVLETLIVSAPDALARKTPEMTWRVRLRTDLNHTDDLGVRFRDSDIKPGP